MWFLIAYIATIVFSYLLIKWSVINLWKNEWCIAAMLTAIGCSLIPFGNIWIALHAFFSKIDYEAKAPF